MLSPKWSGDTQKKLPNNLTTHVGNPEPTNWGKHFEAAHSSTSAAEVNGLNKKNNIKALNIRQYCQWRRVSRQKRTSPPFPTGSALFVWLVRDRKKDAVLNGAEEDWQRRRRGQRDGRTDMWFPVGRVKSVVARVVLYEKWPINN